MECFHVISESCRRDKPGSRIVRNVNGHINMIFRIQDIIWAKIKR